MKKDRLTNKPKEMNYLRQGRSENETPLSCSLRKYDLLLGIGAIILGAALLVSLSLPGSAKAADLTPIEQLGKHIFFDNTSSPQRMSCSTCHSPDAGWTYPVAGVNLHQAVATGANPHTFGNRKPPSNAYATFSPRFTLDAAGIANGGNFWDGRSIGFGGNATGFPTEVIEPVIIDSSPYLNDATKTLYKKYLIPTADQALNPFPNHVEMNIPEEEVVLQVASANYAPLWKTVWGEPIVCSNDIYPNQTTTNFTVCQVNYRRIALALAAYQASGEVNSFSSRDDAELLTEQEKRGEDLFDAKCAGCHGKGTNDPKIGNLYTDHGYFNTGIPANPEIPGFDPNSPDLGLFKHTGIETHKGLNKVPTMRNVDKRPGAGFPKAYGHNGFFKSLEEIVHFYNTRDVPKSRNGRDWPPPEVNVNVAGKDILPGVIGNLGLTPEEEADIVAFLKALTDRIKIQEPQPYKEAK